MRAQPVCNCFRSPNVPMHPTKLQRLTGAPYPPSREPMNGSDQTDPFIEVDVENTAEVSA